MYEEHEIYSFRIKVATFRQLHLGKHLFGKDKEGDEMEIVSSGSTRGPEAWVCAHANLWGSVVGSGDEVPELCTPWFSLPE